MDRGQNRGILAATPGNYTSLHLLRVHMLSLLVLKFAKVPVFVSGSTVCLHDFLSKLNEINELYKLCQVRSKHTVGGIVIYEHTFLVSI